MSPATIERVVETVIQKADLRLPADLRKLVHAVLHFAEGSVRVGNETVLLNPAIIAREKLAPIREKLLSMPDAQRAFMYAEVVKKRLLSAINAFRLALFEIEGGEMRLEQAVEAVATLLLENGVSPAIIQFLRPLMREWAYGVQMTTQVLVYQDKTDARYSRSAISQAQEQLARLPRGELEKFCSHPKYGALARRTKEAVSGDAWMESEEALMIDVNMGRIHAEFPENDTEMFRNAHMLMDRVFQCIQAEPVGKKMLFKFPTHFPKQITQALKAAVDALPPGQRMIIFDTLEHANGSALFQDVLKDVVARALLSLPKPESSDLANAFLIELVSSGQFPRAQLEAIWPIVSCGKFVRKNADLVVHESQPQYPRAVLDRAHEAFAKSQGNLWLAAHAGAPLPLSPHTMRQLASIASGDYEHLVQPQATATDGGNPSPNGNGNGKAKPGSVNGFATLINGHYSRRPDIRSTLGITPIDIADCGKFLGDVLVSMQQHPDIVGTSGNLTVEWTAALMEEFLTKRFPALLCPESLNGKTDWPKIFDALAAVPVMDNAQSDANEYSAAGIVRSAWLNALTALKERLPAATPAGGTENGNKHERVTTPRQVINTYLRRKGHASLTFDEAKAFLAHAGIGYVVERGGMGNDHPNKFEDAAGRRRSIDDKRHFKHGIPIHEIIAFVMGHGQLEGIGDLGKLLTWIREQD